MLLQGTPKLLRPGSTTCFRGLHFGGVALNVEKGSVMFKTTEKQQEQVYNVIITNIVLILKVVSTSEL